MAFHMMLPISPRLIPPCQCQTDPSRTGVAEQATQPSAPCPTVFPLAAKTAVGDTHARALTSPSSPTLSQHTSLLPHHSAGSHAVHAVQVKTHPPPLMLASPTAAWDAPSMACPLVDAFLAGAPTDLLSRAGLERPRPGEDTQQARDWDAVEKALSVGWNSAISGPYTVAPLLTCSNRLHGLSFSCQGLFHAVECEQMTQLVAALAVLQSVTNDDCRDHALERAAALLGVGAVALTSALEDISCTSLALLLGQAIADLVAARITATATSVTPDGGVEHLLHITIL